MQTKLKIKYLKHFTMKFYKLIDVINKNDSKKLFERSLLILLFLYMLFEILFSSKNNQNQEIGNIKFFLEIN